MEDKVSQYVPLNEVPVVDFTSLHSKLNQYIQKSIKSYDLPSPAVMISKSEKYIAVLVQGALVLYEASSLNVVKSLRFGRFPMFGVALSRDSKYVAYGGFSTRVTLFDIQEEESVAEMSGHEGFIMTLAFSRSHVISGAQDGKVVYWNLETKEADLEVKVSDSYVTALAVDSEDKYLFTGDEEHCIKIWKYQTNTLEATLKGHSDRVIHLQLSSDNQTLISSSYDHTFKVWNLEDQSCIFTSNCHDEWVTSVTYTPDEKILIASSRDKSLSIWNTSDWTLNDKLNIHDGIVVGVVSIEGVIISVSEDRTLKTINFTSESNNRFFKDRIISYRVSEIFINEDTFDIITAGTDGDVIKEEGLNSWKKSDIVTISEGIISMKVLKDSTTCLFGHMDGNVSKYNITTGNSKNAEKAHKGRVMSIDVNEDRGLFVTSSDDKLVKVWNLENLTVICEYSHEDRLIAARLTADCDKVVSRGYDGMIKVFEIASESVLTTIKTCPTSQYPETLVVSVSNQIIFSEGNPGVIHIYTIDGFKVTTLNSHTASIVGLCLTSDGKYLYSIGKDKTEKDDYIIRGSYINNLKVWSLDEMLLLLQYTVRFDPADIYISKNDKYVAVISQTSEYDIFKHELNSEDKDMKFYPSNNSFIFANKLMKLLDGKEFKYSSEYKDHLILPYKINLPILYTLANTPVELKNSLRDGAKLLKTSEGDTALSLAIKKRLRECADIILRQLSKVTVEVQPHVYELVEDMLPTLNELQLPGLSTFYINGYETVTSSSLPKYGILKSEAPVSNISLTKELDYSNFADKSTGLDSNEEALSFRVLRFRQNFTAGSQDSVDFLRSLLYLDDTELFGSAAITSIILYKWDKVKYLQAIQAFIYLIFMTSFAMHPYYYHDSVVLMLALLGFNTYFFIYEVFQMVGGGMDYFQDFWNVIDSTRILLLYIYGILYEESHYSKEFIFFITVLTWIRALAYFRIFDATRYLIKMIMEITRDIVPFLVILLFATLGFAYLFRVLQKGNELNLSFAEAFIMSYRANYGDWDLEKFEIAEWVWFFIITVMNPLIMLNLLIAIMGDTYDRVQEMQQVADMKELCSMILEIERILIWKRKQGSMMHIQQCLSGDNQADTYKDMWQGKIKAIKMQIQSINKKIDLNNSNILSVSEKLDSFEKGYNKAIRTQMSNQVQVILGDLDKKFQGLKDELLPKLDEVMGKLG